MLQLGISSSAETEPSSGAEALASVTKFADPADFPESGARYAKRTPVEVACRDKTNLIWLIMPGGSYIWVRAYAAPAAAPPNYRDRPKIRSAALTDRTSETDPLKCYVRMTIRTEC